MDDLNMITDPSLPLDMIGPATSADLAMPDEDSIGNDTFWQQFLTDGPAGSGGMPDASGMDEAGGTSAATSSGRPAAAGGDGVGAHSAQQPAAAGSGDGHLSEPGAGMGTYLPHQQQQQERPAPDGGLQNGGRPPYQLHQNGLGGGQQAVHNQQQQRQQQQQQQAKRATSLDAIKQLQEQLHQQSNSLPASFK